MNADVEKALTIMLAKWPGNGHAKATITQAMRDQEAEIADLREAMARRKPCKWTEDEWDGSWDTSCGNKHQFTAGAPSDNEHSFCPYCGGAIDQAMHDCAREGGNG